MLFRSCYYSLIVGYKNIFKDKETGNYIPGTTFDDIVNLYSFDEELRSLFLEYLFKIEDQIKSLVSYYFSEKYGEQQIKYLSTKNYDYNNQNKHEIDKMIQIFSFLANKNMDYEAIKHARTKHNNVPLWILVTSMTFGNISKMYAALTSDLKNKITSSYIGITPEELQQLLAVTSKFRNVCAHRERMFTYHANKSIPDMPIHETLGIPHDEKGEYLYGKHGLFAVVITLYYLLPTDIFTKFKDQLSLLLDTYLNEKRIYPEHDFLDIIGFPKNWKAIS